MMRIGRLTNITKTKHRANDRRLGQCIIEGLVKSQEHGLRIVGDGFRGPTEEVPHAKEKLIREHDGKAERCCALPLCVRQDALAAHVHAELTRVCAVLALRAKGIDDVVDHDGKVVELCRR
jgi:hypothetical protein